MAYVDANIAGKHFNVHPRTLRKWARLGIIPHKRVGRRVMFSIPDLDRHFDRQAEDKKDVSV